MTTTTTSSQTLAGEFTATLKEWLTPQEFAQVVSLNAAETDATICHSHDFCDANEAMLDAFRRVFNREPFFPADIDDNLCTTEQQDADWRLLMDAWNEAKRSWNN